MYKTLCKKAIRRCMRPFIFEPTFEALKIRVRSVLSSPPLIIYQMGKVGSKTVHRSLQQTNLPNPLYHIHFLSHDGIKEADKYFHSIDQTPPHLQISKTLRKQLDYTKGKHWNIITLVREPIGRDISDLFENLERFHPQLLDQTGEVKFHAVMEYLQKMFEKYDECMDYTCTWFDRELNNAFNIDVYSSPFDHERGFTIINEKYIKLLILRLEDLNQNFNSALTEFLRLAKPIPMIRANMGKEKRYSAEYRYVLDNIVLPKTVCAKVYASKYAMHFYDRDTRETFIQYWSTQRTGCRNKQRREIQGDSAQ